MSIRYGLSVVLSSFYFSLSSQYTLSRSLSYAAPTQKLQLFLEVSKMPLSLLTAALRTHKDDSPSLSLCKDSGICESYSPSATAPAAPPPTPPQGHTRWATGTQKSPSKVEDRPREKSIHKSPPCSCLPARKVRFQYFPIIINESKGIPIPGARRWYDDLQRDSVSPWMPLDWTPAPARIHNRKDNIVDYYCPGTNCWEAFHGERIKAGEHDVSR